jgi:hypothetical protein
MPQGDVLVITCGEQPLICMEIITETTDSSTPVTVADVTKPAGGAPTGTSGRRDSVWVLAASLCCFRRLACALFSEQCASFPISNNIHIGRESFFFASVRI